jgi:hypothetical protein
VSSTAAATGGHLGAGGFGAEPTGASSADGGGATTTQATGGATQGSTGTPNPPEADCLNGVDDDGDDLVDCADDDCENVKCVSVPGDGWVPVVKQPMGDSCPEPWSKIVAQGGSNPTLPEPQCSECTCDATCFATLEFYEEDHCEEVVGSPLELMPDSCEPLGEPASSYFKLTTDASCGPAAGGEPIGEAASFAEQLNVCTAPEIGGGCGEKSQCLTLSSTDARCVYHDGDVSCPEPFKNETHYFGDFDDGRACHSCECGGDGPPECVGSVTLASGDACDVVEASAEVGACGAIPEPQTVNAFTSELVGPSCTPSGGEPKGELKPISPFTICCKN